MRLNKKSFSRILNIFKSQNPQNPLRNEPPHVSVVAKEIMTEFNWGTFNGVPKWYFKFDQRSLARTLGLSLFKVNRAIKRLLELVFERIPGWKAYSRHHKTVVRLKDEYLQLLEPVSKTVEDTPQSVEPQGFEQPKEDDFKTVEPAPLLYGVRNKKNLTPGGFETRKPIPREERVRQLGRKCRAVLDRVAKVFHLVTPYNVSEHVSSEDEEALAAAFGNLGAIERVADEVTSDPKVQNPDALLAWRMANALDRKGLTLQRGRLERIVG